jgi:DNA invertase Pin-like site-specific DNA recombinase
LEAQREAVRSYLDGGSWHPVDEVVEVESGKRNDRPKLAEALTLCRLHGATLIIAKLDRLARNVAFVSNLMESGVDFVAVDFPQANRLTVHILAAVAEHEAAMISQRTKAALAAAKARGKRLGGNRGNIAAVRGLGHQASAVVRKQRLQKAMVSGSGDAPSSWPRTASTLHADARPGSRRRMQRTASSGGRERDRRTQHPLQFRSASRSLQTH